MHKKNKSNIMRATIKSIIVALMYSIIIFAIIYLLFSDSISKAISIVDMISVDTSKKILKDVKINLDTKNLENYPEYGAKYGSIKIPSLNINLGLYYGDTLAILRYGVGHSSGSYFPGEGGSVVCMGHNTKGMLRELPQIKNGEKIIIETTYGIYTYEVYETGVVEQTKLDAVQIQREKEILMLYTCYPVNSIGHAKNRFIVYANLVEEQQM